MAASLTKNRIFFVRLLVGLIAALVWAGTTHAQIPLYSLLSESGGSGNTTVSFSSTAHESLSVGKQVTVSLPDGALASGEVVSVDSQSPLNAATLLQTTATKHIALQNGRSVDLHLFNSSIVGLTITDLLNQTVHRAILNSEGAGVLIEDNPNDYFCAHFPQAPAQVNTLELPAEIPALQEVQNLESRPGAAKVLLIDYFGGTLSGEAWFGGGTINYDAYSLDSDTNNFSDQELYHMYQAWAEAAEDYAAFDVNVTTKVSLFAAAAQANKSRIIATTIATRNTYNLCSGCGGVAWVGQFGFSPFFQTGWTFNSGLGSMGMTHSHEAGHQMGLGHDGGSVNANYYSGHGEWGPIMGAPFNQPYVQWSKGDYPGATNQQDDFSIIDAKLGTLSDEEGASYSSAEQLGSNVDIVRKFVPGGAVGSPSINGDIDYFKFTVPDGGADVSLVVGPKAGLDTTQSPQGESFGSNTTMQGGLFKHRFNENGYTVRMREDDNFPLQPNTNKLEYSGPLTAGDYAFWVEQRSADYDWSTGFDDWGNGGEYRVQLTVQGMQEPEIFSPQPIATVDSTEFFQWQNNGVSVTNYQLYVGSNVGGRQHFNSGDIGTVTSQLVTLIPQNERLVYVRLWYSVDNAVTWKTIDTTYRARVNNGDPDWMSPAAGSALGDSAMGTWVAGATTMDRYRVYAGPTIGSSSWTFTSNLPASTRNYEISGWSNANFGDVVWVRFLWRNANTKVWRRSNHSYVAGFGPATIDAAAQAPVPVGQ